MSDDPEPWTKTTAGYGALPPSGIVSKPFNGKSPPLPTVIFSSINISYLHCHP
jgi:hypothetical protein